MSLPPPTSLEALLALDSAPPVSSAPIHTHRVNANTTERVELDIIVPAHLKKAQHMKEVSRSEIKLPTSAETKQIAAAAASSTSSNILSDAVSASTSSPSLLSRVCGTCHRQVSKYNCPRCNHASCSLACYRSHSTACTIAFASETAQQERGIDAALAQGLGRTRSVLGKEYEETRQARKKTKEMLGRLAEFNQQQDEQTSKMATQGSTMQMDDDEEEEEKKDEEMSPEQEQTEQRLLAALSLLDRLEGQKNSSSSGSSSNPISNADLLSLQSLLPPNVLKDFQRSIIDGRMATWIERWKPWWRSDADLEMEEDKDEKSTATSVLSKKEEDLTPEKWSIPSIHLVDDSSSSAAASLPSPSPPTFSSLFRGSPSPTLPLHVIEVLYAYAFSMMLHNGEETEAASCINVMCELSTVMRCDPAPAAAASATSTPASQPTTAVSFRPTLDLVQSLDATLHTLLTAAASSSLSASRFWSIARIGDTSQLLCESGFVQRALSHTRAIVVQAEQQRQAMKAARNSNAKSASSSSVDPSPLGPKLPYKAIERKLIFLEAFVRDVWQDQEREEWNRQVYAQWKRRYEEHREIHENLKE